MGRVAVGGGGIAGAERGSAWLAGLGPTWSQRGAVFSQLGEGVNPCGGDGHECDDETD